MGNSGGRPSCLGAKSRKPEDFLKDSYLKDLGLESGRPAGRNNAEGRAGPPADKPALCAVVIENGWSVAPGPGKSQPSSPLPKQNNRDVKVQNGSLSCNPLKAQLEAAWSPPRGLGQRGSWLWKPLTTTEVTEVTEVTETVVTETVEVTEYPGGDRSQEPTVTRTVKVLAECAGALPEAAAFLGDPRSMEPIQETWEKMLSWVGDMEELMAGQKPPSSEAKVVKAQLQEQKLLQRLLDERRPHVERLLLQERWPPPEPAGTTEGHRRDGDLASLQEKWAAVAQGAEARHGCLERILPAACAFQASADAFQDWLGATERTLGQLWRASGGSQTQEAHRQTQELCEEMRSKPGELDQALAHGQRLLGMVSGEEAQLAQEKMDALRLRFLMVGQSHTDILHRLEQTLEASARRDPAQEDLALWLSRMEEGLPLQGRATGEGPSPLSAADREKFEQVLASELAQVARLSTHLEDLGRVHLDASAVCLQITEHKRLAAEILHHHGLVERLVAIADPLLSFCPPGLQQQLQPSVCSLQERVALLLQHSSARGMQLEQARVLLAQFAEAQEELHPWLEETQHAVAQGLREAIAEHKPPMATLRRVWRQLADLSPEEAAPFERGWREAEEQYGRVRGQVWEAAAVLEEAIPRYSQLSERMELMVGCLERLQDRMRHPPAVRGDSSCLREQIRDNGLQLAELEELGVALETLRGQGDELLATVPAGANQAIQGRVEQLLSQWKALWRQAEEREGRLQGLLALAQRFWHGMAELASTLSDTQQLVPDLEGAASGGPPAIRARLRAMQALREEIDSLQGDLDSLGVLGMELIASCGDLDKPEVTRSLDELYSAWNSLSKVWTERQTRLEEQLQASLLYQESMERLLRWLAAAELRLADEGQLGGDLEAVRKQLSALKDFKRELYQRKVEAESLRHEWGSASGAGSKGGPHDALEGFRHRWNCLEEEVASRQHQLEAALLGLGQFQSQLEELLQWLHHTAEQLQGPTDPTLDLQSCEIELAKHKVLRTDVASHARTVQAVKEAGQGLLLPRAGDSGDGVQGSLQQLSQRWDLVLGETERRQLELENHLSQVQDLTLEITELLRGLEQVELQLFFAKPSWGHPETIKERLAAHLELCREVEAKQPAYQGIRDRVRPLLLACGPLPQGGSTQHSLRVLEQKWRSVASQLQERKEQLSEELALTTEFQASAQELLRGVGQLEESLGALLPPSVLLGSLSSQIQEQKALAEEARAQREKLASLEALASRPRDFGRKQDCSGAPGLVRSAQERLAKVLQQVGERGALLEEARKRAKQFQESWQRLCSWLEELEPALETPSEAAAASSPEGPQGLLAEHKEFQKRLRAKRPVYEATLRSGRLLREKALLPTDAPALEGMLGQLKERWDAVCSRAAERQQRLEKGVLFSGRLTDALQSLMGWLYRAEPQLAEEAPVAGDRDLVSALVDKHKAFQKELGQRASCVKMLRRSVRDLPRGDSQWLQSQVEELGQRWELTCSLSVSKQARLEAALRQAEEFHSLVGALLGRLSELEKSIKGRVCPGEEAAVEEGQRQLQELQQSLQCQQLELECVTSLGEEILSACHPDAVITVKSWLTVAKSRFQEVLSWAEQQAERLQAQAASLAAEREEVARLMDWITAAEESLGLRDQEGLPEDAEKLEELSAQHTVFMEELNRKQPEVEKVTKMPPEAGAAAASHKPPPRQRGAGKLSRRAPAGSLVELEPPSPLLAQLGHRWQQLWLLALDRQYRLQNAQQRLRELEEFSHFDFAVWRKRYLQWIGHMKSRVLDVFRGIDRDQDGRITQREFMESVLSSKFPTNMLEMSAVADIFDMNRDGFIDYCEFVSALHPSRDMLRRSADADQIQDEVNRQVAQCSCAKRFQVEQISANRYRFGESQQLRMVRILRSTLMVRVGGGWIALDEFLVKNDPCRVKGRTNLKINEKYLSPDPLGGRGAAAPKVLSPSCSSSSLSLYSSTSAPSSPLARKSVLRRTRSGDRCLHSRSSLVSEGAQPLGAGAAADGAHPGAGAAPPEPRPAGP
ncbi:microtubule-actin cross-linking factor 1, isoforms 6/7-like isoform X2 [Hemicordylus capensis]|uniref:microtubule-actin cross-linking factor 1, isoforms 6/7-like isoform X2 n=1 Tax=Hemicordylus capensis TaxID=884348 RepID=UPI00230429CC|nr:microtubule-actin cross-linking factor 1, isoforms 6/7-like isoform X2 [Hemicordylus capensis]